MQWNDADPIRSVEFFKMYVGSSCNVGAVVFGSSLSRGCEVLRVLLPSPNPPELHEALAKLHHAKLREKLLFRDWSQDEVMSRIQAYCQQGLPLPDIFNDERARIEGLTVFQLACYQQTCLIPHGETKSYAWLAERLKKYGAERAVGGAMKSNPFPLLIPCHRVVKKDGNLGGFMGVTHPESWQISTKKALLELEGLHQQPSLFALPKVLPLRAI